MERGQIETSTNPLPEGVNAFTVIFLRMLMGLWSKDFPDGTIQGVSKDLEPALGN
jgi:hypothetical protein